MPWYFPWSETLVLKAYRYVLNRYFGFYISEKLILNQLDIDISLGTSSIKDVSLNIENINQFLRDFNIPLELESGFVKNVYFKIPWSSIFTSASEIELIDVDLIFRLKNIPDNKKKLETHVPCMTDSVALVKEYLQKDGTNVDFADNDVNNFEGVELFAHTLDSILTRIKFLAKNINVHLIMDPPNYPSHNQYGSFKLHIPSFLFYDMDCDNKNGTKPPDFNQKLGQTAPVPETENFDKSINTDDGLIKQFEIKAPIMISFDLNAHYPNPIKSSAVNNININPKPYSENVLNTSSMNNINKIFVNSNFVPFLAITSNTVAHIMKRNKSQCNNSENLPFQDSENLTIPAFNHEPTNINSVENIPDITKVNISIQIGTIHAILLPSLAYAIQNLVSYVLERSSNDVVDKKSNPIAEKTEYKQCITQMLTLNININLINCLLPYEDLTCSKNGQNIAKLMANEMQQYFDSYSENGDSFNLGSGTQFYERDHLRLTMNNLNIMHTAHTFSTLNQIQHVAFKVEISTIQEYILSNCNSRITGNTIKPIISSSRSEREARYVILLKLSQICVDYTDVVAMTNMPKENINMQNTLTPDFLKSPLGKTFKLQHHISSKPTLDICVEMIDIPQFDITLFERMQIWILAANKRLNDLSLNLPIVSQLSSTTSLKAYNKTFFQEYKKSYVDEIGYSFGYQTQQHYSSSAKLNILFNIDKINIVIRFPQSNNRHKANKTKTSSSLFPDSNNCNGWWDLKLRPDECLYVSVKKLQCNLQINPKSMELTDITLFDANFNETQVSFGLNIGSEKGEKSRKTIQLVSIVSKKDVSSQNLVFRPNFHIEKTTKPFIEPSLWSLEDVNQSTDGQMYLSALSSTNSNYSTYNPSTKCGTRPPTLYEEDIKEEPDEHFYHALMFNMSNDPSFESPYQNGEIYIKNQTPIKSLSSANQKSNTNANKAHQFATTNSHGKRSTTNSTDPNSNTEPLSNTMYNAPNISNTPQHPSPFTRKKVLYENKQLILPGSREEMLNFINYHQSLMHYKVELYLPIVNVTLPEKISLELIYNRVYNDLLLWIPCNPFYELNMHMKKSKTNTAFTNDQNWHNCNNKPVHNYSNSNNNGKTYMDKRKNATSGGMPFNNLDGQNNLTEWRITSDVFKGEPKHKPQHSTYNNSSWMYGQLDTFVNQESSAISSYEQFDNSLDGNGSKKMENKNHPKNEKTNNKSFESSTVKTKTKQPVNTDNSNKNTNSDNGAHEDSSESFNGNSEEYDTKDSSPDRFDEKVELSPLDQENDDPLKLSFLFVLDEVNITLNSASTNDEIYFMANKDKTTSTPCNKGMFYRFGAQLKDGFVFGTFFNQEKHCNPQDVLVRFQNFATHFESYSSEDKFNSKNSVTSEDCDFMQSLAPLFTQKPGPANNTHNTMVKVGSNRKPNFLHNFQQNLHNNTINEATRIQACAKNNTGGSLTELYDEISLDEDPHFMYNNNPNNLYANYPMINPLNFLNPSNVNNNNNIPFTSEDDDKFSLYETTNSSSLNDLHHCNYEGMDDNSSSSHKDPIIKLKYRIYHSALNLQETQNNSGNKLDDQGSVKSSSISSSFKERLKQQKMFFNAIPSFLTPSMADDMIAISAKSRFNRASGIKETILSLAFHRTQLHHVILPSYRDWVACLAHYFSIRDFGECKIVPVHRLNQLHLQFYDCTILYKPLYLPFQVYIELGSFNISNRALILPKSSEIKFLVEDSSLYIRKFLDMVEINNVSVPLLSKFIKVASVGMCEITIAKRQIDPTSPNNSNAATNIEKSASSTSLNKSSIPVPEPEFEFKILNDLLTLSTCQDTFIALTQIISYYIMREDLQNYNDEFTKTSLPTKSERSQKIYEKVEKKDKIPQAIKNHHISDLMADAMLEDNNDVDDEYNRLLNQNNENFTGNKQENVKNSSVNRNPFATNMNDLLNSPKYTKPNHKNTNKIINTKKSGGNKNNSKTKICQSELKHHLTATTPNNYPINNTTKTSPIGLYPSSTYHTPLSESNPYLDENPVLSKDSIIQPEDLLDLSFEEPIDMNDFANNSSNTTHVAQNSQSLPVGFTASLSTSTRYNPKRDELTWLNNDNMNNDNINKVNNDKHKKGHKPHTSFTYKIKEELSGYAYNNIKKYYSQSKKFATNTRDYNNRKSLRENKPHLSNQEELDNSNNTSSNFVILPNDFNSSLTEHVIAKPELRIISHLALSESKEDDHSSFIIDNYLAKPAFERYDYLAPLANYPRLVEKYQLSDISIRWEIYDGSDFVPAHNEVISQPHAHNVGRNTDVLMEIHINKLKYLYESYPRDCAQVSRHVLTCQDFQMLDKLISSHYNKFLYLYVSETYPKKTNVPMLVVRALTTRPDHTAPEQKECSLRVALQPLRLNIDQEALMFLCKFFGSIINQSNATTNDEISVRKEQPSSFVNPNEKMDQQASSGERKKSQDIDEDLCLELESNFSPKTNYINQHSTNTIMVSDESESLESPDDPNFATNNNMNADYRTKKEEQIYFRPVIFSPEVPLKIDYRGKYIDFEQGTFIGLLMALAQLRCSEIRLKPLECHSGILGIEKLVNYMMKEWFNDIRQNQLKNLLAGLGPMNSFVQLAQGFKDLVYMPIKQYKRDKRIMKGLKQGASSFTSHSAVSTIELSHKLVDFLKSAAETTYYMLSPEAHELSDAAYNANNMITALTPYYYCSNQNLGNVYLINNNNQYQHYYANNNMSPTLDIDLKPDYKVRTRYSSTSLSPLHAHHHSQPMDIREGVSSAFQIVKEGFSQTALDMIKRAAQTHERGEGITGVAGSLLRDLPQGVLRPALATARATSTLLDGVRHSFVPSARQENMDTWKDYYGGGKNNSRKPQSASMRRRNQFYDHQFARRTNGSLNSGGGPKDDFNFISL